MNRNSKWILLLILGGAVVAFADSIVDQGKPGTRGPWPVTGTIVIVSGDGGLAVKPVACLTNPDGGPSRNSAVDAGTVAVAVPTTPVSGRAWVDLCNSLENASSTLIKCRGDGQTPVIGVASPGDVLNTGDCIRYLVASGVTTQCIANANGSWVTSYECVP